MWLDTNIDNRIQKRFLHRQDRNNQRLKDVDIQWQQEAQPTQIAQQIGSLINTEENSILNHTNIYYFR